MKSGSARAWRFGGFLSLVAAALLAGLATGDEEKFDEELAAMLPALSAQAGRVLGTSPAPGVSVEVVDVKELAKMVEHSPLRFAASRARSILATFRGEGQPPSPPASEAPFSPAGVFSQASNRIMIGSEWMDPALRFDLRTILAHELVHAQRFHDGCYEKCTAKELPTDLDWYLAAHCLVEGDAVFFSAILGEAERNRIGVDEAAAIVSKRLCDAIDSSSDWGPMVCHLGEFTNPGYEAYLHGPLFVARLWQAGGLETIRRAFAFPPRSSEQILHPERYLASSPDEPTVFRPAEGSEVPAGFRLQSAGVMGELEIRLLFVGTLGGPRATRVADGWDGNRYEVFEREDGSQLFAMMSTWDSESDAVEFAHAWCEWAGRKSGEASTIQSEWLRSGERHTLSTGASDALTTRRGCDVVALYGSGAQEWGGIVARLWYFSRSERLATEALSDAAGDASRGKEK